MAGKSPQKTNLKKQGRSLKEKRATKRLKQARLAVLRSVIPTTDR